MIAVGIIGLLALIAIPAFMKARQRTQVTQIASNLRVFSHAFQQYAIENGDYPPDSHLPAPYHLPNALIEEYINAPLWAATTSLGGNYNWEGLDSYPYAGISIFAATAPAARFQELDEMLDDGVLSEGQFRQTPNGRYTFIVEE
jgi:type IV pilus assembly protein PilA